MFRFFKRRNIPPCRICVNGIVRTWENLYGGVEEELRCQLKSDLSGDYCLCDWARGSKQCKFEEGIPIDIKRNIGY